VHHAGLLGIELCEQKRQVVDSCVGDEVLRALILGASRAFHYTTLGQAFGRRLTGWLGRPRAVPDHHV